MDIIFSVAAGLGLRLLLVSVGGHLNRVSTTLLGLWEGAVVHQLARRSSAMDQYLAYGLRLILDLFITQSFSRMIMTLLWTALGMLISEAAGPNHGHDTSRERRHRDRHTRSIPSRVRVYRVPVTPEPFRLPSGTANLHASTSQQQRDLPAPSTSTLPPAQSSPPKPTFTRPKSNLGHVKPIHLPTPPATEPSATFDIDENPSLHYEDIPQHTHPSNADIHSRTPSVATSDPLPIPLPVANTQVFQTLWRPTTPTPLDELRTPTNPNQGGIASESDPDELLTPDPIRRTLVNPSGFDELRTPILSPLATVDYLRQAPESITRPPSTIHPLHVSRTSSPRASTSLLLNLEDTGQSGASISPDKPVIIPLTQTTAIQHESIPDLSDIDAKTDATSVVSTHNPAQLFTRAEFLRQQARNEEKERGQLESQYREALRNNHIKDAFFIKGRIRESEITARKLHERAARRFYLSRNVSLKPHTIDVHGLRVSEAIQRTEQAFRQSISEGHGSLNVIVGKGLHSQGGIPIIKNAVIREMEAQRIPCRVDRGNAGILILNLPPD
ncbi:hypothetical protein BD779DRAFT_1505350 [Infundibulicybe gibba]|nr:hypothetical protein BD779DRAFT_1505350 [Infundibulicybe gibba]